MGADRAQPRPGPAPVRSSVGAAEQRGQAAPRRWTKRAKVDRRGGGASTTVVPSTTSSVAPASRTSAGRREHAVEPARLQGVEQAQVADAVADERRVEEAEGRAGSPASGRGPRRGAWPRRRCRRPRRGRRRAGCRAWSCRCRAGRPPGRCVPASRPPPRTASRPGTPVAILGTTGQVGVAPLAAAQPMAGRSARCGSALLATTGG